MPNHSRVILDSVAIMRNSSHGPVLHLIDTTGPGGAETIFIQIASGLRERGWSSRVAVVGPGWVLDGVRERNLAVDVVATRSRFDVPYLLGIRQLIRRHGVKLIHAHLYSPAVYASLVGAWTRTPVVATFHGASDAVRGGWSRQLRYRLMGRQAAVVCVSEALASELRSEGRYALPDIRVIHNGVDPAVFAAADGAAVRREHGVPSDTFLVGSLGNMRPAKDFPTLFRAAALLGSERRVGFAIVGQRTEPLYADLVRLRDQLGLQDRVSFWGFRDDAPAVLAAFDVLAISSSSEGFSLAAVQAMAAGTPVVATRCGGPEEILTNGVDGILVPPATPEALAAAIRDLSEQPELRKSLAAEARRTAASRFSVDVMLDRYEQVYTDLLGTSPMTDLPQTHYRTSMA